MIIFLYGPYFQIVPLFFLVRGLIKVVYVHIHVKEKGTIFRRATLLHYQLRKNWSKLLKLHLMVRSDCARMVFYYYWPKDWSEIMIKSEKTFYMYRQSVYSSRLFSSFLLKLIYSFYFINSNAFRKLF